MGLKSPRVKLLSLAAAHVAGIRYIGVFLDPVIACNIRCKMCYFADDESRPTPVKPMSAQMLSQISRSLWRKAIKLQIGCGAEPTLYKALPEIIREAKAAKIPYIEITTNGQLVDYDYLKTLVVAGLNGMTLSLHGTSRPTYEFFMERAEFDNLLRLIDAITKIQSEFPDFTLRINYTFNNDNIEELQDIWQLFKGVKINVLQIRPIQDMGSGKYTDFDMSRIIERYDTLIKPLADYCSANGVTFIGPTRENLLRVDKKQTPYEAMIEYITYCYVSPTSCYHKDFDLANDTFRSYHKRNRTLSKLIKLAFSGEKTDSLDANKSKKLNYKIS